MARSVLPKAERAIISAHEAGMHERKPIPATCRECAIEATAEKPAPVTAPEPIKVIHKARTAKPTPKPVKVPPLPAGTYVSPLRPDAIREGPHPLVDTTEVEAIPETREAWLLRAADKMRPWFEDVEVPTLRVSIGWAAGRGSSRSIGQCWYSTADKAPALFISPALTWEKDILSTLLHEMIHAAVGEGKGHKGPFVKVGRALGFTGPWKSTPMTPELGQRVNALSDELGPFPHSKVNRVDGAGKPAVQTTRMLKVQCTECGCIIRMTIKWIEDVGLPTCGCGGEMEGA